MRLLRLIDSWFMAKGSLWMKEISTSATRG